MKSKYPNPSKVDPNHEDSCMYCGGYGIMKGVECWGCGGSGSTMDIDERLIGSVDTTIDIDNRRNREIKWLMDDFKKYPKSWTSFIENKLNDMSITYLEDLHGSHDS